MMAEGPDTNAATAAATPPAQGLPLPARLPWPVAASVIFGLGVLLWWLIFRVAGTILG